jgi:hypothetical protein
MAAPEAPLVGQWQLDVNLRPFLGSVERNPTGLIAAYPLPDDELVMFF